MNDEKTMYRERTPWPAWVAAIYWGALGGTSLLMLSGYDTDLPTPIRALIAAGILGAALALGAAIKGLTVQVQETRVFVHLGTVPIVKRIIAFDEIVELESVTYHPLRDFGGWGARGVGKDKAWTARGDRAVLLTLTEGRTLHLGSDNPQRLEERIRTAAGDRLGSVAAP